jgi:hypothetical protein
LRTFTSSPFLPYPPMLFGPDLITCAFTCSTTQVCGRNLSVAAGGAPVGPSGSTFFFFFFFFFVIILPQFHFYGLSHVPSPSVARNAMRHMCHSSDRRVSVCTYHTSRFPSIIPMGKMLHSSSSRRRIACVSFGYSIR